MYIIIDSTMWKQWYVVVQLRMKPEIIKCDRRKSCETFYHRKLVLRRPCATVEEDLWWFRRNKNFKPNAINTLFPAINTCFFLPLNRFFLSRKRRKKKAKQNKTKKEESMKIINKELICSKGLFWGTRSWIFLAFFWPPSWISSSVEKSRGG